jgi:nucleoside-diphosphate-sugar epimerase
MTDKTAFIAGASGAIGQVLCKLLVRDGWHVHGTTRSSDKAIQLRQLGVIPVVVDVFDRDALTRAVCQVHPTVVVHQLTDLPKQYTPQALAAALAGNARIREVGTDNLVSAAVAAGAKRIVAQSIAFAYASGPQPYSETSPLDKMAHSAVIKLEELVLHSGLDGIVLRYGRLYGPNTWTDIAPEQVPVHVDAAADAARQAMTAGQPGVYNINENDRFVTSTKAQKEFGWSPDFRLGDSDE